MPKPTSQMHIYIVKVTGYASTGEGVARLDDGRVAFIRNAARGDVLEIKLTKEQPRSAHAEIVRILEPSPYRIEPDCQYYSKCGGCNFRHIAYEEELEAKLLRVNDAIRRIGGLSACACEIIRTGQINGYRNKAVFHFDGTSWGFFRAESHEIIHIDHCLLLKDDLNAAIKCMTLGVDIQKNDKDGEITLRSGWKGLSKPIEEKLDDLVFQISGFFQINTGAALLLYQKAREYAAMTKNETLIDLYCGVGSLTLFIGRDAGKALGVELNPEAIKAARANAQQNDLSYIEFIAADVAKWKTKIQNPDCIVVDPPRAGLSPGAIEKLLTLSPKRIVYVSCDPATLARDLRMLKDYVVKDICAVDMFPRTANVECCCLLLRNDDQCKLYPQRKQT